MTALALPLVLGTETRMTFEDAPLVDRILKGERDAFSELVTRFQRTVYGLAYRMTGSTSEAEDLCQEIFLRVYQGLPRFDRSRPLAPWVRRIASNHVLNHLRARAPRSQPLPEGDGELVATGRDPESAAVASGEGDRVARALLSLPDRQRLAITMKYLEGLTAEEIGEALEVPRNTVKTWLFRARETLRERLS